MNIEFVNNNFEALLKSPASKDAIFKVRDAINYTTSSGLSNLNKLIEVIHSDGSSDLHKSLCSKLFTIGTSIDIIFTNSIDLTSINYNLFNNVGDLLTDLEAFCAATGHKDRIKSGSLCIGGVSYDDYLKVNISGKITRVKPDVK